MAHLHAHPVTHRSVLRHWQVTAVIFVFLCSMFSACSAGGSTDRTVSLVAIFPSDGASGVIGQSMAHAVDLAVKQHAVLGGGYALTVTHINESSATVGPDTAQAVANSQALGVVGPFGSDTAITALPTLARAGVVTISPTAMLPGLTQEDQATAEGAPFAQWRSQGKPINFYRLTVDDNAAATAAAKLAAASPDAHGLGSQTVFVVDDGSLSGKAQSAAFQTAFKAKNGSIDGARSITSDDAISVQTTVSAIIEAHPDSVFVAGDPSAIAAVRRTLTQVGAPSLPLLTAGVVASDPQWADAVGAAVLSANTTAILPAQDLTKMPGGQSFETAYQSAYPGETVTSETALAYDAAMIEITAIKSLIAARATPTRAAVLAAVATENYTGVSGKFAFDKNGDPSSPSVFSVYSCDMKGTWTYQMSIAN